MTRFWKKLIYGLFYLAVLVFVVFSVYSAALDSRAVPAASDEVLGQNFPVPEIPQPTFVFEDLTTEIDGDEVRVVGVLKNEGPQVVPRVVIRAVLFSSEGSQIFSSETLKEDIRAFESRSFTVFFPKDQGLAEKVEVDLTSVSYVLQ